MRCLKNYIIFLARRSSQRGWIPGQDDGNDVMFSISTSVKNEFDWNFRVLSTAQKKFNISTRESFTGLWSDAIQIFSLGVENPSPECQHVNYGPCTQNDIMLFILVDVGRTCRKCYAVFKKKKLIISFVNAKPDVFWWMSFWCENVPVSSSWKICVNSHATALLRYRPRNNTIRNRVNDPRNEKRFFLFFFSHFFSSPKRHCEPCA